MMMEYDVRFQVAGEDQTQQVEAASAAEAAQIVQEQFFATGDVFELIQVTLLEDNIAHEFPVDAETTTT